MRGRWPEHWPEGQYRTIVVDPPWRTDGWRDNSRRGPLPYATLSLQEIAELPVPDLYHPDGGWLYLWTTTSLIPAAMDIGQEWELTYRGMMGWRKSAEHSPQPSQRWRLNWEPLLVFTWGRRPPRLQVRGQHILGMIDGPFAGHGVKPGAMYDQLRRMSPEPRIDLFARRRIEGYDGWGVEYPDE